MNEVATTSRDPATVARVIDGARKMYPEAEIRVRRGRVLAIEGDLIRVVAYRVDNPRTHSIGDNQK